jgi:hypothetical protein
MLSERERAQLRLPGWLRGAVRPSAAAEPAGRPVRGGAVTLLIPDLATTAALAALCYCLFLFDAPRRLFHDSDTGWHIRTGEAILDSGRLPYTDPYSFTRGGRPWVAWEWGSDVLMGAAHRAAGLDGVAALYISAIACSVWLWFRLNWAVGGGFLSAGVLAAPMLSTVNLHWLARPHVFGWLLTMGAVLGAERLAAEPRLTPARGLAIAGGAALWANLHASFFLAALVPLVYAAGYGLRAALWRETDHAPEMRIVRVFLWSTVLAAAASLVNPYGWNLHRHLISYLSDSELMARIGEFQSFNFHAAGAGWISLALLISLAGACAAFARRRVAHAALGLLLVAGALRSARVLPLMALIALPFANGALAEAAVLCGGLRPAVRRRLDALLTYSGNLRRLDARVGGAVWLPLAAAALFAAMPGAAFPPSEFPVRAAATVELLPGPARLLATDRFGGYLIYRFAGRRKVFFDGRSDLYGSDFLIEYGRLIQARPGWQAMVERYRFTHALLPADCPLAAALEAAGWKRTGADAVAVLLERNS